MRWFLVLLSLVFSIGGHYPSYATVVDLDVESDIVSAEDNNGFVWDFYGVEDYDIGDGVALVMYDNGTVSIFDDVIVDARYVGSTK